jgi:hypothetical protein
MSEDGFDLLVDPDVEPDPDAEPTVDAGPDPLLPAALIPPREGESDEWLV